MSDSKEAKWESNWEYWCGKPKVDIYVVPLPPKEMSPNARVHFRVKSKAVQEHRQAAIEAAQTYAYEHKQMYGRTPQVLACCFVRICLYKKTVARPDPDNIIASMKAAIDGLRRGGIFTDDADLIYLPSRWGKDALNPRAEIHVYSGPNSLELVIDEFRRDYGNETDCGNATTGADGGDGEGSRSEDH